MKFKALTHKLVCERRLNKNNGFKTPAIARVFHPLFLFPPNTITSVYCVMTKNNDLQHRLSQGVGRPLFFALIKGQIFFKKVEMYKRKNKRPKTLAMSRRFGAFIFSGNIRICIIDKPVFLAVCFFLEPWNSTDNQPSWGLCANLRELCKTLF